MPIRKFNPTSPGSRFRTVQTFDDITTNAPYRPLTEKLERSGGRIYGPDGAANLLGINPTTLVSRLKALGLRRPSTLRPK